MAYQTGVVNNLVDIQTAIRLFLVANGWTWAGGKIYKGQMFVEFIDPTADKVLFRATTALTGGVNAPYASGMGSMARVATGNVPSPVTFPATYWAFLSDDEFYFILNYDTTKYQYVMWGLSTINLGAGATGMYISGTVNDLQTSTTYSNQASAISIGVSGNFGTNQYVDGGNRAAAPFWKTKAGNNTSQTNNYPNLNADFVHNAVGGAASWLISEQDSGVSYSFSYIGNGTLGNIQSILPNAWNGESPFLPIRAYKPVGSSKIALVVDLWHARQCRIDNFSDNEIVTIGADEWQVFPFHRRNMSVRNGGVNIDHTGTFGWAIRKVT